ncbi:hypothetical protein [Micromonospora sp. LOL_023]|uniref:hypothetical protein n=1 Tax=Micromonospora sp. LOL_023 TaxID=3345418 RepID=UPI003A8C87B6
MTVSLGGCRDTTLAVPWSVSTRRPGWQLRKHTDATIEIAYLLAHVPTGTLPPKVIAAAGPMEHRGPQQVRQ